MTDELKLVMQMSEIVDTLKIWLGHYHWQIRTGALFIADGRKIRGKRMFVKGRDKLQESLDKLKDYNPPKELEDARNALIAIVEDWVEAANMALKGLERLEPELIVQARLKMADAGGPLWKKIGPEERRMIFR